MSLNKVTISGNLAADAVVHTTQSGVAVLSFSVAVNERTKDRDGNWSDYTNWIDCVMFGQRAQSVQPYLTRGSKVAIIGHLRAETYEKDGVRRKAVSVRVDDIEFMNGRRQAEHQTADEDIYF